MRTARTTGKKKLPEDNSVKRKARQPAAIDLFCGAGGSSWGARNAGVEIVAGFDMWDLAGEVYKDNFPGAKFYEGRLEESDPSAIKQELGEVDIILASPECTNHSVARAGKDPDEASRATAWQVTEYAKALEPRWIVVENVGAMRNWKKYGKFLASLYELGYNVRTQMLNAKDFRVAQSRARLFIMCDRVRMPPKVTGCPDRIPAQTVVSGNGEYCFSPLHKKGRADKTIERAERAIDALGRDTEFLMVYYGSDKAGGFQSLDVPLRTITTLDRFALVRPNGGYHEMRMLQPPELQAAMGLPQVFKLRHGSRREKIRLLGNGVCPQVMRAVVESLCQEDTPGGVIK